MNWFRLKEWWRYYRAAKGRHGVHSPFVYRFIDKGLRKSSGKLQERCISFLREEGGMTPIFLPEDPKSWNAAFAAAVPLLRSGSVIFINGIHRDPTCLEIWRKCCADKRVNLSLEFWQSGLLFYRTDFKEKQHFILRRR